MNEIYTVEELAYRCLDFGEHVDKIAERVNLGDVVRYDNDQLDSTHVILELIEDDSDKVNELLSCLSIHTPLSRKFAQMIDDKTQELAEEAARSYKGKYDE
jgi:hypothetical protein